MQARPDEKEEKKETPQPETPAQIEAAEKKKALQKSARRYYLKHDNSGRISKKPKITRTSGAPDADEEAERKRIEQEQSNALGTLSAVSSEALLPEWLSEGTYDIEYEDEYSLGAQFANFFKAPAPKKILTIRVDKEGGITLNRYPESIAELKNFYTQTMRLYKKNLGVVRLKFDYSAFKDNPNAISLKTLESFNDALKIAEKEGVVLVPGPVLNAKLHSLNKNNRRERKLFDEITARVARLEQMQSGNVELNKEKAQTASAFNLNKMRENLKLLDEAGKAAAAATTAQELKTAVQTLKEAQEKVSGTLSSIESDMKTYPVDAKISQSYQRAATEAKQGLDAAAKTLETAKTRIAESPDDKKESDALLDNVKNARDKSTQSILSHAENELKNPEARKTIKINDLQEKIAAVEKANKEYQDIFKNPDRTLTYSEGIELRNNQHDKTTALTNAMNEAALAVQSIHAEINKPDTTPEQLKAYRDALALAEKIRVNNTPSSDVEFFDSASKDLQTSINLLTARLSGSNVGIAEKITPPVERERARWEASKEVIKELNGKEKLEELVGNSTDIEDDIAKFTKQAEAIEKEINAVPPAGVDAAPEPEKEEAKFEKLKGEAGSIEQQHELLATKTKELSRVIDVELQNKSNSPEVIAALKAEQTRIAEWNKKIQAMQEQSKVLADKIAEKQQAAAEQAGKGMRHRPS